MVDLMTSSSFFHQPAQEGTAAKQEKHKCKSWELRHRVVAFSCRVIGVNGQEYKRTQRITHVLLDRCRKIIEIT